MVSKTETLWILELEDDDAQEDDAVDWQGSGDGEKEWGEGSDTGGSTITCSGGVD